MLTEALVQTIRESIENDVYPMCVKCDKEIRR